MFRIDDKNKLRKKRHLRVRKNVYGDAVRPRLNVFRSTKHIYAQVIDDSLGRTLVSVSTMSPEFKSTSKSGGNVDAAKQVGRMIAEKALEAGIKKVVFDRGGYLYHGRVAALATAAREAGLEF